MSAAAPLPPLLRPRAITEALYARLRDLNRQASAGSEHAANEAEEIRAWFRTEGSPRELLACFLIFSPAQRVAAINNWADRFDIDLPVRPDAGDAGALARFEDAAILAAIGGARK